MTMSLARRTLLQMVQKQSFVHALCRQVPAGTTQAMTPERHRLGTRAAVHWRLRERPTVVKVFAAVRSY